MRNRWATTLAFMTISQGCFLTNSDVDFEGIVAKSGVGGKASITCPNTYGDFVPVRGNPSLSTNDFCVMKYEARNIGSVAISQAAGTPWVNISADDSWIECDDLNDFGQSGTYALISNPEWMTIARDAESLGGNWSGSSVGVGEMARGWTAHVSYGDSWTNSSVAPNSQPTCLYNTASNTCASSGDHRYRRTLSLSTGEDIWDFSGNVWNWVDWEINGSFTLGPTTCPATWDEFPNVTCAELDVENDLLPSNQTYDSSQSVGQFYGASGGAALRGGGWNNGSRGGAFTLNLDINSSNPGSRRGFRCVWRPN